MKQSRFLWLLIVLLAAACLYLGFKLKQCEQALQMCQKPKPTNVQAAFNYQGQVGISVSKGDTITWSLPADVVPPSTFSVTFTMGKDCTANGASVTLNAANPSFTCTAVDLSNSGTVVQTVTFPVPTGVIVTKGHPKPQPPTSIRPMTGPPGSCRGCVIVTPPSDGTDITKPKPARLLGDPQDISISCGPPVKVPDASIDAYNYGYVRWSGTTGISVTFESTTPCVDATGRPLFTPGNLCYFPATPTPPGPYRYKVNACGVDTEATLTLTPQ